MILYPLGRVLQDLCFALQVCASIFALGYIVIVRFPNMWIVDVANCPASWDLSHSLSPGFDTSIFVYTPTSRAYMAVSDYTMAQPAQSLFRIGVPRDFRL